MLTNGTFWHEKRIARCEPKKMAYLRYEPTSHLIVVCAQFCSIRVDSICCSQNLNQNLRRAGLSKPEVPHIVFVSPQLRYICISSSSKMHTWNLSFLLHGQDVWVTFCSTQDKRAILIHKTSTICHVEQNCSTWKNLLHGQCCSVRDKFHVCKDDPEVLALRIMESIYS